MGLFDLFKKKSETRKPTISMTVRTSFDNDVMPIEKRVQGKTPSCNGLYPHEVLVLSYADKYFAKENSFPGFWWHKYGIKNVQSILYKLSKKGLIEPGGVQDAIQLEKGNTIKEVLKKHKLSVSGSKAAMTKRLIENVPEEVLLKEFPRIPYKPTAEGEGILKEYAWIPYIHSHTIEGLDIWNLTEKVQAKPGLRYRDIIWGHLNKQGMKHSKAGDFGLYCNTRLTMATFVAEEEKFEEAFRLMCQVVEYDLSGLSNNFSSLALSINTKHFFPYKESMLKIPPGIIRYLNSYQKKLKWSDDKVKEVMLKEVSIPIPFRAFTPEECVDIFFAEREKDTARLEKIYANAEKRLKKK